MSQCDKINGGNNKMSLEEIKQTVAPFFPNAKWESGRGWIRMVGNKSEILITGSEIVAGNRGETGIGKGMHFSFDACADDLSGLMPALSIFEEREQGGK